MKKLLKNIIMRLRLNSCGQALIEYIIIIAFVALAGIGAVEALDNDTNEMINAGADRIKNTTGGGYAFVTPEPDIDISAILEGWTGEYDGEAHTGSVTVTDPASGYVIAYGTDPDDITLTELPEFTEIGSYTVYVKIIAAGYRDYSGTFTVEIEARTADWPSLSQSSFTYDTQSHSVTVLNYDSSLETMTGTSSATNAGSYEIIVSLIEPETTSWPDGTRDDMVLAWTIDRRDLSTMTMAALTEQTYTGSAICPEPAISYSSGSLTVTLVKNTDFTYSYSCNVAVGDATVTCTAVSGGNYSGFKSETFSIVSAQIAPPWAEGYMPEYTYTGSAIDCGLTAPAHTTRGGTVTEVNAGTYTVTLALSDPDNYCWTTGGSDTLSWSWKIKQRANLAVPTQTGTLYQTAALDVLSPTFSYDHQAVTLTGGTSSSEFAGTYYATFSINDPQNCQWADGTTEDKTVPWTINLNLSRFATHRDDLGVYKFFAWDSASYLSAYPSATHYYNRTHDGSCGSHQSYNSEMMNIIAVPQFEWTNYLIDNLKPNTNYVLKYKLNVELYNGRYYTSSNFQAAPWVYAGVFAGAVTNYWDDPRSPNQTCLSGMANTAGHIAWNGNWGSGSEISLGFNTGNRSSVYLGYCVCRAYDGDGYINYIHSMSLWAYDSAGNLHQVR